MRWPNKSKFVGMSGETTEDGQDSLWNSSLNYGAWDLSKIELYVFRLLAYDNATNPHGIRNFK